MVNKHNKLYYWYWSIKLWIFKIHDKYIQDIGKSLKLKNKFGLINEDLSTKHCYYCGHDEFKDTNVDILDGQGSIVCEYDVKCKRCNNIAGHWAYGNWCV